MGNELEVVGEANYPLTAKAVVARVRLIQEVMNTVMKKDTHYGTIPGTQKPTLYKPGAEQLLVTFRIAPQEPKVEDLSTADAIRYRVTRTGVSAIGAIVASGVGECSSDEEKYKWRKPVCDEEYDVTPEDRRREKWMRGQKGNYKIKQVRTNPPDVANTILKMADKRAFVAMTLLATAASDIFTQDLEDLPQEVAESIEGVSEKPAIQQPAKKSDSHSEPSDDGSDQRVSFIPVQYATKNGTGDKGPWTKHAVKSPDGAWFSSFDAGVGAVLKDAADKKAQISFYFKRDGQYSTITRIAE